MAIGARPQFRPEKDAIGDARRNVAGSSKGIARPKMRLGLRRRANLRMPVQKVFWDLAFLFGGSYRRFSSGGTLASEGLLIKGVSRVLEP